jgi:hypothetical protein
MIYLQGEKVCICGLAEVVNPPKKPGPQVANSQIHKEQLRKSHRLDPQIENPQSATFVSSLKS